MFQGGIFGNIILWISVVTGIFASLVMGSIQIPKILMAFPCVRSVCVSVCKCCSMQLVGFYGISTIVGYLKPNPFYAYILNIYDLVWLGFLAY